MPFVIDASVVMSWLLLDEKNAATMALLDRTLQDKAVAPRILWFEVRNALLVQQRRGRVSAEQVDEAFTRLNALHIDLTDDNNPMEILALARRESLSFYDASYLALAISRSFQLASLDKALINATSRSGIANLLSHS